MGAEISRSNRRYRRSKQLQDMEEIRFAAEKTANCRSKTCERQKSDNLLIESENASVMNWGGKVVVNRAGNTVQLATEEGLAATRCDEETCQRRRRNKSFDAAAEYTIVSKLPKGQITTLTNISSKNHDIDV